MWENVKKHNLAVQGVSKRLREYVMPYRNLRNNNAFKNGKICNKGTKNMHQKLQNITIFSILAKVGILHTFLDCLHFTCKLCKNKIPCTIKN